MTPQEAEGLLSRYTHMPDALNAIAEAQKESDVHTNGYQINLADYGSIVVQQKNDICWYAICELADECECHYAKYGLDTRRLNQYVPTGEPEPERES